LFSKGATSRFDWKYGSSKCFGTVTKPIARVFLKKSSGEWLEYWPDVDSGAIISLFNKGDCELLGYKLKDGDFCELIGVGGCKVPSYVHSIDMRIAEDVFRAKVAFSDTANHPLLLGRLDVFSKFEIDLRGRTLDTYIARDLED
jgi:hypothetical protein